MGRNLRTGRASALLGALTYNAERERLEAGEDKLTAHSLGLETALKQLQTATTSPAQKATLMGHPEAARPLSVLEYRRVQGFPDSWELPGSQSIQYKQVGNAVSVHLARALARHCLQLVET